MVSEPWGYTFLLEVDVRDFTIVIVCFFSGLCRESFGFFGGKYFWREIFWRQNVFNLDSFCSEACMRSS